MHHPSSLKDPLAFLAPLSPFQTSRSDPKMYHKSTGSPSSQTHRHPMERTSSRDPSTPVSAGSAGHTDSSTRHSHKRARSNSSASTYTNADRSKHQDRNTWPGGPPPTIVQRTPSSLQRSSSTSGRNSSQPNLQLSRSISNSSIAPSYSQRSHSNHSTPILSRKISKSSQPSPTQTRSRTIFFYHKHEPHYGFTNFSNHGVKHDGKVYPTSEHLFQSMKVCAFLQPAPHRSDPTDLVPSPSVVGRTYPHVRSSPKRGFL